MKINLGVAGSFALETKCNRLKVQSVLWRLWDATNLLRRSSGFGMAVLAASTMICSAGPCSSEIAEMQARLDARLAAVAAAGPSAPEGSSARLHHQPTPGSIAAAERALGRLSPDKGVIIRGAMARAREADKAGDWEACMRALDEVRQTISP